MRCIVVAGTGTEVGKTYAACSLLAALARSALSVVGLKPIESGGNADERRLAAMSTFPVKRRPPYQFDAPVSPHLAARAAGVRIDLTVCLEWMRDEAKAADIAVVELAGGLFSPLGRGVTNADLTRALGPLAWVLVAPDRLGVLHELKSTLLAAYVAQLPPPLVTLNQPATPDASTGVNAEECVRLGLCHVAATFHWGPVDHPHTREQAARLARLLLSATSAPPGLGSIVA